MAKEFKLPNLGEGVESGDVVGVAVKAGDKVSKGQGMLEVETNKAVMDVPAPEDAVISSVTVKPGDKVKPGQVVVTYEAAAGAAKASAPVPAPAAAAAPVPAPQAAKPAPAAPAPAAFAPPPASSDGGGRIVPASPSVRKFARELGVNLADVRPSGPQGRVLESDVKNHVKQAMGAGGPSFAAAAPPPLPDFTKWGSVERAPLKGVRKATAEGMARAWAQVPHVTQFDVADITGTESARKRFADGRKGQPGKVTLTVLAIKAVTKVLAEFPHFASSIDMARNEIVTKAWRHIGVAVDSPGGLMVPVLRDVDRKSLVDLATDLESLAEKVRTRKISLDEMQGGVFTISNLGGIGGTFFTPIVNWPEVAILGISKSRQELQMVDGQIEARQMLGLSLSYDHRVIDGADGARFLKRVCEVLSNPFELVN
ncbi:MAG TPA: dihydrolipoamide acetyltransferase family protein [bacterium]|nr:dihydrolipoamide acetyltransferase family protein [bacterium]